MQAGGYAPQALHGELEQWAVLRGGGQAKRRLALPKGGQKGKLARMVSREGFAAPVEHFNGEKLDLGSQILNLDQATEIGEEGIAWFVHRSVSICVHLWLSLGMIHLSQVAQHLGNIHTHRADLDAAPAAGASR